MEGREICPRAGMLVMFPGWLNHGVIPLSEPDADDGGGTRVAIAFNVHRTERERR